MGSFLRPCAIRSVNAGGILSAYVHTSSCIHRCKLLVVGGGTGGCTVAWRFAKKLKDREIIVLEPSQHHYYQPLFTLVAAGIKKEHQSRRPLLSVLPSKVCWFKDHAAYFEADKCTVHTCCGDQIRYEYLVIALGLVNRYEKIPGLEEALNNPSSCVSTIYSPQYCTKTWDCMKKCRGGHAVFTFPYHAGKCAGAAQKIMYLADDYWRKQKRRNAISVTYNTGGDALFGVPKYAAALSKVTKDRCMVINCHTDLVEVTPCAAVFQVGCEPDQRISVPYNFLHVTPPMCPPEVLRCDTRLVNEGGFLDVDRHTLQHNCYQNIFGLGDCTSTPNSKTAAAIGPQSQVLEENLTLVMQGKDPKAKYDGYGSCPMLTSYRRGILAEFKYGKKVCETFPFDQSKERRFFYQLMTHYLPRLYWNKLIKGKWNGPKRLRRFLRPLSRT